MTQDDIGDNQNRSSFVFASVQMSGACPQDAENDSDGRIFFLPSVDFFEPFLPPSSLWLMDCGVAI